MGSLAKQLQGQSQQTKMYAKGGKVKHDDAAEDKKLIQKQLTKAMSKSFPNGATITPTKKGGKCK